MSKNKNTTLKFVRCSYSSIQRETSSFKYFLIRKEERSKINNPNFKNLWKEEQITPEVNGRMEMMKIRNRK